MKSKKWQTKLKIIRHYNRITNFYDSLYSFEQNSKIKSILNKTKPNKTDIVLDLGCGTGFLFEKLDKSVKFILGIDVSREALKKAIERTRKNCPNTSSSLICADADFLPLRKEVFDKVFLITILQNIPDYTLILSETSRVTKKDGIIIITGLKKNFTFGEFREVLNKSDLKFFFLETKMDIQDHIAICQKKKNDKKMKT
jgi:malonyl-CoA O-methyltransferase